MGTIADSMVAYAQPLIDETDGSQEQMNKAFGIAQLCWNLSLTPENDREKEIAEIQKTLKMGKAEFSDFRRLVIDPMILRHHKMFPNMPRFDSQATAPPPREKKYPGTGRNAPCPCKSGKKYKRCCGK